MEIRISSHSDARSFALLAPRNVKPRKSFRNVSVSDQSYDSLLASMQRLRGRVYMEDDAIGTQDLTADGRHILKTDEHSWHLLILSAQKRVLGCARYLQHVGFVSFHQLRVRMAPVARNPYWGPKMRVSVDAELNKARVEGFTFVEIGGWALAKEIRGTAAALKVVLATYAWSHQFGGAVGLSTATERNGSASILRRLGGEPLEWNGSALPPYFDEQYGCRMEVLRFDSRRPNPKYAGMIQDLAAEIRDVPVIASNSESHRWSHVPEALPQPLPLVA